MKCMHCQGKMERKAAPFHIDRKGYHLLFDAMPAWVCDPCREVYFEEADVGVIQKALRSLDEHTQKLLTAV